MWQAIIEAMRVFTCSLCGVAIIRPVERLGHIPPIPEELLGNCGALGASGPDLLCTNGHEVATEVSDCHTLNGVWLLTGATTSVEADR